MLVLTVLGCDGSHAGAGGAGSGYLLRAPAQGTAVWIDAGPGTFAHLQQFCDPRCLDAVVLTHSHVDHCSDLDGFVAAARFTLGWDRPPLPVFAAPGVTDRLHHVDEDVVAVDEIGDGAERAVGGLRLRFSRTDHPPPTFAVRVDDGVSALGYSADSGPGWSLEALGPGLDLALCEATYTHEHEGTAGHMSARQAGRSAAAAGAARLVLTHRWTTVAAADVLAEAAACFDGPLAAARIGHGYTL